MKTIKQQLLLSSSNRPTGVHGRSTSTHGCCRSGSCSSRHRSTTTSGTSSWHSCCTLRPRPRTGHQPVINSPGGDVPPLLAIYDTMQYVRSDVSTICMGQAASAAAVLLLAGAKGKRLALLHSRVILRQPEGGAEGQAIDVEIQAKEITRTRRLLEEVIAEHTGQPLERVAQDTDRDFILTPEKAVEYGVVDDVIATRNIAPELGKVAAGARATD